MPLGGLVFLGFLLALFRCCRDYIRHQKKMRRIHKFVDEELAKGTLFPVWQGSAIRAMEQLSIEEKKEARDLICIDLSKRGMSIDGSPRPRPKRWIFK